MTFMPIPFALLFFAMGVVLVYGTYRRWPGLVDPPDRWLSPFYSQALLKKWFGRTFVIAYTYILGLLFVAIAGLGLWNGFTK